MVEQQGESINRIVDLVEEAEARVHEGKEEIIHRGHSSSKKIP